MRRAVPPRGLERLRFGPRRTLNVREAGLSGDAAARRVDGWLRSRQVELEGDVLIITGRGAGSQDGIAVVREATLATLRALRRSGVVQVIQEDTAGSFVVTLAPLRTMLEAATRRRAPAPATLPVGASMQGLPSDALRALSELAKASLAALGIGDGHEALLRDEMERQFSLLVRSAPVEADTDAWLRRAILRALRDYE